MEFISYLRQRWLSADSLVCVGLDPYPEKFPAGFSDQDGIFQFNKAIIDATHDLVCAYKPQFAHFAAVAAEDQLKKTIHYIKSQYPEIPVILDAKRGDIGSTASMYAKEAFVHYQADAVTVNPYMGVDTVAPFTEFTDKGTILLCRTSNPGAVQLQNLDVGGYPLYEEVARLAAQEWNHNNNVMLVVGATAPEEMARIRRICGDMPMLVPGIGAQGGDIAAVLGAGKTTDGTGLIINSSRAVLYASSGDDFAEAARAETLSLKNEINLYR
ncbi:orotidine-5'-phosphate decarboxylase [Gynuella sp.]|uniref:orotidine-5'-phosphate decarboxylase n=1 Tax=Gynuella sp. TaxID=2969146 RepID=UPI003D0ABB82